MAFLNNVALRPSCIVSALPERFRAVLEKELSDSVAISTCKIGQLENAVKLRGATIAVVGASNESLEIAERLSHDAQSVKVFLVHYQDSLGGRAETNGFAGVYDFRTEPKRLAQSIRQQALEPARPVHHDAADKPAGHGMLRHFIAMQERLSTPHILMEMVLDGFLEAASATSGVLLVPADSGQNKFKIIASRGEDVPQASEQVVLPEETILEMHKGATLFFPEGVPYSDSATWYLDAGFSIGVPLVAEKKLLGCLIATTNRASENLAEYGVAATHIFTQLRQKEAATQRERLIAQARRQVSPGWLLATDEGRVIYREGDGTDLLCNSSSEITSPRLRHAVTDAHAGRSGSIPFRDSRIVYQPIRLNDAAYVLLNFAEEPPVLEKPGRVAIFTEEYAAYIQSQFADSPEQKEFVEALLKDLEPGKEKPLPADRKALARFGIELAKGSHDIPDQMAAGMSLLLMALARIAGSKISFSFFRNEKTWALTFEHEEKSVEEKPSARSSAVPEHPLIRAIFQMMGDRLGAAQWRFSAYGGRCEGFYLG